MFWGVSRGFQGGPEGVHHPPPHPIHESTINVVDCRAMLRRALDAVKGLYNGSY